MYAQTPHPYLVQAVALWLSFLPGFAVLALFAGTWREALRRTAKHRENKGEESCKLLHSRFAHLNLQ